ncbi:MAG TPA: glycine--tRNA ligase subunit beta [bacterium]|nr:glycine--tRNA ligase subunit beta [bacterium]HPP29704.1 glycine--tRNA ligase subunit beta [bacterium]
MGKKDILIEIGCEDLPSWAGEYFKKQWVPVFTLLLTEYRIEYGEVRFFYTIRRLVLYIKGVSSEQRDITTEIYGPPAEIAIDENGHFTSAALKFAASHNLSVDNLLIRERKGKKVLAVAKYEKGKKVFEVIGEILEESIKRLEIPRGMKWNGGTFRFLRPIRWIMLLYGKRVINISLSGIKSGSFSYGHRTLAPAKFKVLSPSDYMDKILKKFVIFDPDVRFEFVKAEIYRKTGVKNFIFDDGLLRKIVSLVEYPVVEVCQLKKEYMEIPQEIVSAVIIKLNGIPLLNKEGCLDRRYIAVFDGIGGDEIKNNYQDVLYAKMEDALFFIKRDLQVDFASYTKELKNIAYHPKWGSMYERIERFKKIYSILTDYLNLSAEEKENIYSIISLCKNDLPTLMVTEFPSLEGVIGRIYAEKNGYNSIIASGIEQHYWPRYSGDNLPRTIEAAISSIIVRLETICGFLLDNMEIKGSGDPYGLKKTTNGLIEIIWDRKLNFPLREIIRKSLEIFGSYSSESEDRIMDFILQRIDNMFAGEGISPGIRKAVMAVDGENLVILREKIDALEDFFKTGAAKNILVPFIRVANILKQAKEKGISPGTFEESLLVEETEKELYYFYRKNLTISKLLDSKIRDYQGFLQQLSKWREIIDRFFDDVLVMCEDEKIRNNRLALLKNVNDLFLLFADFSLIPIVEVEDA